MELRPTPRARGTEMRMDLIQPFINAADAVLAQGLQSPTSVANLSMEQEAYRRKGVAALIWVTGDIEGRLIIDLDPSTAVRVASRFAGAELPESDELVRETVCELANQVIGNAVTTLNDQGFHFRIHPPVLHTSEHGPKSTEDTEALVICFDTAIGSVFLNIALRHNCSRAPEQAATVGHAK
jgi:chemotaxis protein CheX